MEQTVAFGYDARVLRVLIASPGDVKEERDELTQLMTRWNGVNSEEYGVVLQPVRWELDATPEQGERPQGVINRQLVDRSEILIGLFFSRLGTPTGVADSGTIEEIERFVATGRPVLLYFSNRDIPQRILNGRQFRALQRYKKDIRKRGLDFGYDSIEHLRLLVSEHLTKTVQHLRRRSGPALSLTSALTISGQQAGPGPVSPLLSRNREVGPPTEQTSQMTLTDVSAARLIELATLVLGENLDDEHREWPRIRWKTIYTIDLRRRIGAEWPHVVPDTLMQMIRSAGVATAEAIRKRDSLAVSALKSEIHLFQDSLRPAWFVEHLRPADVGPQLSARPWPHSLPASVDPEAMRNITARELARILQCEILVYALVHIGTGERLGARTILTLVLEGDLSPIAALVRELLIYNGLRSLDSLQVTPPPPDPRLEPARVLDFLWPEGRTCALELDYLVRWPHRMDIVVLSNESEPASVSALGPFPTKHAGYDESYRSFIERGRERGINIVIGNYTDLDLLERRTAAWGVQEVGWKRYDRLFSEFFYDKFPTDKKSIVIKDQMAKDPRLAIWNKVVFTELLADKYQLSMLLEAADVPVAAPSRRVSLDSTRDQRTALMAELKQAVDDVGLDVPPDAAWLVVKPLTGFGGNLVRRMTEQQFFDADFDDVTYAQFAGVVVQPFFESAVSVPELGIEGRHDVRIVFVGYKPIFGMIRELPRGVDEIAATLENVKKYGGTRRYVDVERILCRADAKELIGKVHVALGTAFGGAPGIYSVDFFWVEGERGITPMVVELNSKPSQVWQPGDQHGRMVLTEFHKAIVGEMGQFYDEQAGRNS
jgi:hypothetical protein